MLDDDITYTNWGITGSALEPMDDINLGCASMCLGNQCNNSNTWKAVDCNTPQLYICQIECESIFFIFVCIAQWPIKYVSQNVNWKKMKIKTKV